MNIMKSNCHTHTSYCDGKNTAEEMILAAVSSGFNALGFSGHIPMNFENEWAMTHEKLEKYYNEITALKEKYKDRIEVLCGIELDADFELKKDYAFDYTISSVHQIHKNGKIYAIDLTAQELKLCADTEYGGNWNKLAEEYFENVADLVIGEKTDVVGHFDLITKFNKNNCLFDVNDEEYQKSALKSIDRIMDAKPEVVFEVNTGAMYRCGNEAPYPAKFIMERIKERGGRVTVSSDAHCTDAIDFAFDKAEAYCKECGFNEIWHLTGKGFISREI